MKRFIVIGLGKFGFYVAKTLFEEGNVVVAVDIDRSRVQDMDPFCHAAVVMDATEKDKLKSIGVQDVDAVVVSVGSKISSSILITLYLSDMGVKHIVVKAVDQDHAKILKKVGATDIIHPEMAMGVRIARGLSTPNMIDYIPLGKDYDLLEITPPNKFVGKSLRDLDLRAKYNVHVMAVKESGNDSFLLIPSADFVIKENDILMILGKHKDIRRVGALK